MLNQQAGVGVDLVRARSLASWKAVIARGGFVWNLLRDPDGRPALTGGVQAQPTNASCEGWLGAKCGNASWAGSSWAMMMSPQPGSERQSVAAFMLLRGPYAWWGRGWLGGDVYFNEALQSMEPGEPSGVCTEVPGE
eukprot:COSAG01_NODE_9243_length_2507_cov_4.230482_3_plen_137_part_00